MSLLVDLPRSRKPDDKFGHAIGQLRGRNPYRVPGGRSPKKINPKLRICKGSNTWYQSSVLGISLPFHSRLKQFLQLLKRSSPNSVVISTTADHLLISLDYHSNRTVLFDGIEEGGVRASAYSSHEIDEHDNDLAMEGLQDRVNILKRLTGDIHEEVRVTIECLIGHDMDSSRGILSGTMDRFKMVFETKSSRRMATLVASFVALFLLVYFLTK
ncbi:hypothetical protein C4D60_Mb07t10660 [Musa balbisiana]|uniref:t-SNARE coiled-coil homology domain-containing protein n=1 Tax=Musa balbisiana TaxID=52838 RepID=A0A4S8JEK8_MUSBA|nr:hypothetical protein C4D60_Mb07t10660 [Musa balbisiana]